MVDAVNAHLRTAGFRLLKGIEVDILDDGALDQTEEMLGRLDVVVASVHSKLRMEQRADDPPDGRARSATRETNVLGPLHRPAGHGRPRAPGRRASSTPRRCSRRAREHDVAVEINRRPERQDPPDDLVELALEIGCLFSIDSDAHAPGTARLPRLRRRARAARARRARRTGSSPPGRWTGCSTWANGGKSPSHVRGPRRAAPAGRGTPVAAAVAGDRGSAYRDDDGTVVVLHPRPDHPGRGAGVGRHDARPAREVRAAPPALATTALMRAGDRARGAVPRRRWPGRRRCGGSTTSSTAGASCTPGGPDDPALHAAAGDARRGSSTTCCCTSSRTCWRTGHTKTFWRMVDRFPKAERAKGFLEGVALAARLEMSGDDVRRTSAADADSDGRRGDGQVDELAQ